MNKFIEEAAIEEQHNELTFEDGLELTRSDIEIDVLERDFNKYISILDLDLKSKAAIETASLALVTTPETISDKTLNESALKKIISALYKFIKKIMDWVKTKAKDLYGKFIGDIDDDIKFIRAHSDCIPDEKDINSLEAEEKKKAMSILREALISYRILYFVIDKLNDGYIYVTKTKHKIFLLNTKTGILYFYYRYQLPEVQANVKIFDDITFDRPYLNKMIKNLKKMLKESKNKTGEILSKRDVDFIKRDISIARGHLKKIKMIRGEIYSIRKAHELCVKLKNRS